jgi:hypothetical protein
MAARRVSPDDFWRNQINALTGPFPEVGAHPPEMELEAATTAKRGRFMKMSFDVFLFADIEENKCLMIYNQQRMWDYGEMTLVEALAKAKRRRR